ncbi:MAG TPA: type 1 glutamine amidotransferase [Gaiellaceae bacterium]|nr:type 1 glutamine amidotransferase [Gaiellaceae bacterium]
MRLLAVVHGTNARGGVFEQAAREAGHAYEEWDPAWGKPLARALEAYDAVFVFGGTMHPDTDDENAWLRDENVLVQELVERGVPTLGICLGAQLIAKAEGSAVYPLPGGPETGWVPVDLTEAGRDDPVVGVLPKRFDALAVHVYTYDVPERAQVLVAGPRCNQAFRLGERAWAIQFHPEATLETVRGWLFDGRDVPGDRDAVWAQTQARIAAWNDLGRTLCGSFLAAAARAAVAA